MKIIIQSCAATSSSTILQSTSRFPKCHGHFWYHFPQQKIEKLPWGTSITKVRQPHTPHQAPKNSPQNTPGLIRNGEKVRNMSHPHVPHFLNTGVRCQPLIISRNLLICQLVEKLVIDLSIRNEVHLPSRSILPSTHATVREEWDSNLRNVEVPSERF